MTSIQINFIRTPNSDGHDDDILDISKISDRQYSLSYRDKTSKNVDPLIVVVNRDDIFEHIETTFDMLSIDVVPFKQVQISAPAFPSIMLNVSSLDMDYIRETVYRVVETTLNNWPTMCHAEHILRRSPRLAAHA